MKRKNVLSWSLIAALLTVALSLTACATTNQTGDETMETTTAATTAATTESIAEETEALTLDELLQYDGQDGRKAYIAVDGIIYDVTDIPQWALGIHADRFQAGQDYSEEIRSKSPHGIVMLSRAVEVGILIDD